METSPSEDGPGKRFPEGFALGAAAIFGAVIVLAGLLAVRQLTARSETETAAETAPDSEVSPTTIPPAGQGEDEVSGGFGDLPQGTPPGSDDVDGESSEQDDSGEDEAEGGPPTTVPNDVETLPCPDGVEPVICDAAEFVQQMRGRPFKTFPVVELMENEAFDSALLSDFELYREGLEVDGVTLRALGLLAPDVSLADTFRDSLEVGVVGFYDPETGQLVVRGADLSLYTQLVLVHELVHAFDDQWFDLNRDDFIDDEADYGFSAVVEGNASRVEAAWRTQLSAEDRLTLSREELDALSPEDIGRLLALPPVIRDLQGSPYIDGEIYVDGLAAAGGEEAVDRALETPPSTSEEVLHPRTDRRLEPEIEVVAPPADGEVIDEGRLGELTIRLWLGRLAGEGWGGDRFVTWTADGRDCIAVDLIGDNDGETAELDAAADAWAGLQPETRSVAATTVDSKPAVRVRACG